MNEKIQCLIVDDEPVAREIMESLLANIDRVKVAGSCKNAVEAFNAIHSKKIDLIFLDINMPGVSGLSFARSMNKNIKIIFTTAYREYAADGFDLQAVDYLLKPISFERLLQAMNKYFEQNLNAPQIVAEDTVQEKDDSFFVRADRKMVRVNFNNILYIESISDYVKIHLRDKTIVTRETITGIEAKLPQNDFVRTHRSYVVSMSAIDSFTAEYVEIGKHQIPVSRSYRDEVLRKLEKN